MMQQATPSISQSTDLSTGKISLVRQRLDRLLVEFNQVDLQWKEDKSAFVESENFLTAAEEAQKILQVVAQAIQEQVHDKIAAVVTRCLETIFDEPYQFKIEFERKRGRTEANLIFVRGGLVLTDPINEAGGGVIDVAAFALRLACLILERPIRRRVLVLDEPFSKVRGSQNRQRMRELIESLAEDFGVQFILNVDGDVYPEFMLGTVIELG